MTGHGTPCSNDFVTQYEHSLDLIRYQAPLALLIVPIMRNGSVIHCFVSHTATRNASMPYHDETLR